MTHAVQGRCPACGSNSLFLGSGGYVTCSVLTCREPTAAADYLRRPTLTFVEVRAANAARCRRWHPDFPDDDWSAADWSNAMCGEAGEAANVVKKIRRHETGHPGANDPDITVLVDMLGDELADTLAYLDLLAAKYGINLGEAVSRKFNAVSLREGFPERLR